MNLTTQLDGDFFAYYDTIDRKYANKRVEINRPNWTNYFLGLAYIVAQRSCDAQTQHGAILTDKQHRILGVGYNSFARHLSDHILPNLRPDKYKFMQHAEINAIFNMAKDAWSNINGITAYITGRPCIQCLQALISNNINHIYVQDRQGSTLETAEEQEFNFLILDSKIQYETIILDSDWLTQALGQLQGERKNDKNSTTTKPIQKI